MALFFLLVLFVIDSFFDGCFWVLFGVTLFYEATSNS